jgi:hypothetical protein
MQPAEGLSEIDPVCGMKVDPAKSPHRIDYGGRSRHFLLGELPKQILV